MKLYEVLVAVEDCIDTETGELDVARLNALEITLREKISNCAMYIKNRNAEADALMAESKRLAERGKAAAAAAARFEQYVIAQLEANSVIEVKSNLHKVRIVENPPKVDDNVNMDVLPDKFKVRTIIVRPDKEAILTHHKEFGETPTGASVSRSLRLKVD